MSTPEKSDVHNGPDGLTAAHAAQKREEYSKSLVLAKMVASTTEILSPAAKAALKMRRKQSTQSSSDSSRVADSVSIQAPQIEARNTTSAQKSASEASSEKDAVELAMSELNKKGNKDAAPNRIRQTTSHVTHAINFNTANYVINFTGKFRQQFQIVHF
jgi:hypothetical protein